MTTSPAPDPEVLPEVELRCPVGPKRLFGKLRMRGEKPSINIDNLIEMSCQDCRRRLGKTIVRCVLHRFNIIGELVETEVLYLSPPVED